MWVKVAFSAIFPHILGQYQWPETAKEFTPSCTSLIRPKGSYPSPSSRKTVVHELYHTGGNNENRRIGRRGEVGTLTCRELPTGVAPARAAVWLAEGRIPLGVHPPEAVLDPVPFFKELERREIYPPVSITEFL
jgi:hypothetical protein